MSLGLLLKHEFAPGLDGEILFSLDDVADGTATPDQQPLLGVRIAHSWPGHVQEAR